MKGEKTVANQLAVTIQLGKKGLTPELVIEMKKQLKKRGAIKVRILRNALSNQGRKEIVTAITNAIGAEVSSRVGNTLILNRNTYKRKEL